MLEHAENEVRNRRLAIWFGGAALLGGSISACQADCEEKLNSGPDEPDDGARAWAPPGASSTLKTTTESRVSAQETLAMP